MSNDEPQELQAETPGETQPVSRKKSNRASGKTPKSQPAPAPERRTTRDGKHIRKTASGFTVVG